MAGRIGVFDWHATPLGPMEAWPDRLRGAVETMLAAPQIATLAVGPDRVFLYNDEAARYYGGRHPAVLGRPLAEAFAHEYRLVEPFYDRVFAGESLHVPAQELDPAGTGAPELFDACLVPVRDGDGRIVAVGMTGFAVRERRWAEAELRESEARQAFLLKLSDALRPLTDPVAIQEAACRLLAERLDVDRAYYVEIDEAADVARVERDFVRAGALTLAGEHRAADFAWSVTILRRGDAHIVPDIATSELVPPTDRPALAALGIAACMGTPLIKSNRLTGALCVTASRPRAWTANEVGLVQEVGERIWAAVERARAEDAMRKSEESFRHLFEAMGQGYVLGEIVRDPDRRAIDLRLLDVNPAYERLMGLPAEQARGQGVYALFPDIDLWWLETCDRVARTGQAERVEQQRSEGGDWFEAWVYPRGEDRVEVLFEDITERKRAEETLRESEERQAFLLKLSDELRAEAVPADIERTALEMLAEEIGLDRAHITRVTPDEDRAEVVAEARRGLAPVVGLHRLSDFPETFRTMTDSTLVSFDMKNDPQFGEADRRSLKAVQMISLVVVSLREGPSRVVWTLACAMARPRQWTPGEIALIENVAERTWAASERARVEATLRESEEKYRTLFHTMGQGFIEAEIVRDSNGHAVDVRMLGINPAFERLTGVSAAEALGRTNREVVPDIEDWWIATAERIVRLGVPERVEAELAALGRWFEVHFHPGGGDRFAALYDDITERKRAEAVLRESEERQAFLLMLSDRLRTQADPRAIAATSVTLLADHLRLDRAYVAEVDKERDLAEIGPEYRRPVLAPVKGVLTLSDFPEAWARVEEATLVLADTANDPTLSDHDRRNFADMRMGALIVASARKGTRNPVWALLAATEEPRRWTAAEVALVEEVAERTWAATERCRTEAALRASEERLRAFGEAAQDILWIRDAATMQWVYLTPAFETIYGRSREEALAGDDYRKWQDLIVPEDRDHAIASIERVRAGERVTFEYRIRRASDGAIRWLRNTDFPIADEAGKVVMFGGIGHDFTDAREAELRQRTLIEGMPQLVWRVVDGGRWTWASPQWIACTGQREVEYRDWGWLEAVHPDDRDKAREAWARALDEGGFEVEYRIRRRSDGAYRWFQTRAAPVRDEGGTIVEWLGTSTDIDDLRQLQDSQRILLAELQHRVRNVLAVTRSIIGRSDDGQRSAQDYVRHLQGRIAALARTQVLLTRRVGTGVDLDNLIREELLAQVASGDQFTLEGPDVQLSSKAAEVLTLAVHELATNATKYGAFSRASGRLDVRWAVEERAGQDWLVLDWTESGVPIVNAAPRRQGFGTELVARRIPYELKGHGRFDLRPGGLHSRIEFPLTAGDSIFQTGEVLS